MKKHLSLLLALCLTLGLCLPAAATTDSTDVRLAAVTQKVKDTLDLDTSAYTDFSGNLNEDAFASNWYLYWNSDNSNLNIIATEDGKILSYNHYYPNNSYYYDYGPNLPKGDINSARQSAMDFLDRVLDSSVESASVESESGDSLNSDNYSFSGIILLNGITSPFNFYITVNGADNTVTSFYRYSMSDNYEGNIPSATPAITADQAAQKLKTSLSLNLEYVLNDSGVAVLRYLPVSGDQYYVDAQTGDLVDLTALYNKLNVTNTAETSASYGTSQSPASTFMEDKGTLTYVEEAGAEKLAGVLSKTELDAKLKALTPLNLSGYTLSSADYSVGSEEVDGQTPVSVALSYSKQVDAVVYTRYLTVDGRTGELNWMDGYTYSQSDTPLTSTITDDSAQALAKTFLTTYYGDHFAKTALYSSDVTSDSTSATYTYCQTENGYFYTGNYFSVTVDLTDGSIQAFNSTFDDSVVFDSTAGIVDKATALNAYLAFYHTPVSYLSVPTAIDFTQPRYEPLKDMGYSYLYTLKLGYQLSNSDSTLLGIDAKTGKAVTSTLSSEQPAITYNDLECHWVQSMADTLATYHVGFDGGSFLPNQSITQVELVDLLVSAYGSNYDITDPDQVNYLYSEAYSRGILTSDERNDTTSVTRAEMVKMLMDGSGYGRVASLEGIFNPGFTDDSTIPDGYVGYVALAHGFGLVQGDDATSFRPNASATRAEAIAMLFRYMSI